MKHDYDTYEDVMATQIMREPARYSLARKILSKGRITRSDLALDLGLSLASVTNYSRWMQERGIVVDDVLRMAHSKRPVQQLRLNPSAGAGIVLSFDLPVVRAEVFDLGLEPIATMTHQVEQMTQRAVFQAMEAVIKQARVSLQTMGQLPLAVGLGVTGYVAPDAGIIFQMDGVEGWVPCQPRKLIPSMADVACCRVWPRVACKLRGLASRCGDDSEIGYADFCDGQFHVATMQHGGLHIGRYGTSGSFLHQSVADHGGECFCGRTGCLASFIHQGQAKPEWLTQAVFKLLEDSYVKLLGIEWPVLAKQCMRNLARHDVETQVIDDGQTLAAEGLRILTAEVVLDLAVQREEKASV